MLAHKNQSMEKAICNTMRQHTHTHKHKDTHKHTHTHTQTQRHTHTHTHTLHNALHKRLAYAIRHRCLANKKCFCTEDAYENTHLVWALWPSGHSAHLLSQRGPLHQFKTHSVPKSGPEIVMQSPHGSADVGAPAGNQHSCSLHVAQRQHNKA